MSVLDEVTGKVKSAIGVKSPAAGAILSALVDYLHAPDVGGLPGLVKKFETAGLGAQIQSWISGGHPLPITPDQVSLALGNAEIAKMATKAGLPTTEVTEHLTEILPDAVNHLTPGGKIPSAGMFGELIGSLKDKFGK
ncbi:MAG TPA: YidB family protein [Gemmatimonadaceae bacterium]|nr:YidB family protein [Gemmatimonadaceae bacterium]